MKNFVRLSEVCTISASKAYIEEEDAWLLNLDKVESKTGRVLEHEVVPKEKLNGSIVQFDTGNVLYSKLRPNLNKVVLPEKNGYATSEMLPLRPCESKLTKGYLAEYLRSDNFVSWAVGKTAGAKMPRLGTKVLMDKMIPLPPLEEQHKIVSLFSVMNHVISLRQQQLAKLDELVKARFVEMFASISNKVNMEDVCKIITDGTHQPPKFTTEGIPFLFVSNIITNKICYDAEKFITEEVYTELVKRTPIEMGDVLLSTVGSYGHPAVVKSERPFCFQRHIAYLKPDRDRINSEYLHSAILSDEVQRQIDERVKGIAQKTLNLSEIRKLQFPLPSIEKQNQFAAFVGQIDKSKISIKKSIEQMEILKRALMQQYFE